MPNKSQNANKVTHAKQNGIQDLNEQNKNISPVRSDRIGFETFVMTGEKIIRTSKSHQNDTAIPKAKVRSSDKASHNGATKIPSPTKSPSKKSNIRPPSRIPKPSAVKSSPRSSPRSSPVCSPKLPKATLVNSSHTAMSASAVPHIDSTAEATRANQTSISQENVNNNVITEAWIKAEATRDRVQDDYDPDRPPPKPPLPGQASPMLRSSNLHECAASPTRRPLSAAHPEQPQASAAHDQRSASHGATNPAAAHSASGIPVASKQSPDALPPLIPYKEQPRELDIPPDDISAEDTQFCNESPLVNMDELPPPPEELLVDSFYKTNTSSNSAESEPVRDSLSEPMSAPPNIANTSWFPQDKERHDQPVAQDGVKGGESSSSANGASGGGGSNGVRTSKSHENYLQQCNSEGLTMVDIDLDIDDNIASSVDVLSYEQSSTSLNSLGHNQYLQNARQADTTKSKSVDNSPEKRFDIQAPKSEHANMPSFIACEEPRAVSKLHKTSQDGKPDENAGDESPDMFHGRVDASTSQTEDVFSEPDTVTMDSNLSDDVQMDNDVQTVDTADSADNIDGSVPVIELDDQSNEDHGPSHSPDRSDPPSPDYGESDIDSIYHQPIKDVDRPSASRLAKRLYNLEGFKKTDIARHLCKKNDFSQLVGEEYLSYFNFIGLTLDGALRMFLEHTALLGETQERERILSHFSHRYVECNPGIFNSEDACHTLTCGLMLLNTDLHSRNIGRKMTLAEFIENLRELNDGEDFCKDLLKQLYTSIKEQSLGCEIDNELDEYDQMNAASNMTRAAPQPEPTFIGHNPFLDIPDVSKAKEYKKGYVMKKCCVDPDGRRTPIGKRSWRMVHATLRDMVLYMHKDEFDIKRGNGIFNAAGNVIHIHHALASRADDYKKKQHVFRLKTADGAQYLFQSGGSVECDTWIETINFVAAFMSAPPLPGAVGSQKKFQRPLMPSSYTKLNMREQLAHHEQKVLQLEQDLTDHRLYPPDKGAKSRAIQDYMDKEAYLQHEITRFKIYSMVLQTKMTGYNSLEPSLVEVAITEGVEPPASPSQNKRQAGGSAAGNKKSKSPTVQRSMSDRYSYRAAIYSANRELDEV